jgi:hypothetical protein
MSGGAEKAQNYIRLPKVGGKIAIPQSLQEQKTGEIAPEMRKKFSLWSKDKLPPAKKKFINSLKMDTLAPNEYFNAFGVNKPDDFASQFFKKIESKKISQPPVKDASTLFDYFVEGSDFMDNQQLGKTFVNRLAAYVNLVMRDILIDQVPDNELKNILRKLDHRLSSYKSDSDDPVKNYILAHNRKRLSNANLSLKDDAGEGPSWYQKLIKKDYIPADLFAGKVPTVSGPKFIEEVKNSGIITTPSRKTYTDALSKLTKEIVTRFKTISDNLVTQYEKENPETAATQFGFEEFAKPEESAQYLRQLPSDKMIKALRASYGMLNKKNWAFSLNQLQAAHEKSTQAAQQVQENILSEQAAGASPYLGSIYVGVNNVVKLAETVAGSTDNQIFELFDQLNTLTTSLEKFYATGLQQGGKEARDSAEEIESSFTQTGELK